MSELSSQTWWSALDHLEEQWPERLEHLLKSGRLKKHLDELTRKADLELVRLEKLHPETSPEVILEHVGPQMIYPENPAYIDETTKPLSPAAEKMLESFREKMLALAMKEEDQTILSKQTT